MKRFLPGFFPHRYVCMLLELSSVGQHWFYLFLPHYLRSSVKRIGSRKTCKYKKKLFMKKVYTKALKLSGTRIKSKRLRSIIHIDGSFILNENEFLKLCFEHFQIQAYHNKFMKETYESHFG